MSPGKFVSGYLVSFLALVLGCMAQANPQGFGNNFPKGPAGAGNYDLPPPPVPEPVPVPVPTAPLPPGPFPGLLGGLGGILGGLPFGLGGGLPFGLGGGGGVPFGGFTPSYVPQTWLGSLLGAKSDFLFPLVIIVFFIVGVWAVIQFLLMIIVPIIGAKLGVASALLGSKKLLRRREVSDSSAEADDKDLSDLTLNVVNATEKSY